jgi:hypothetical protein
MLRRTILGALLLLGLLAFSPKPSEALGVCDNSDRCYSYCTLIDSQGNVRHYVINRGGPGC